MRLQTRTSLYNILYSGIILIFTGIFLEIALIKIFYKQVDDSIRMEREIIEEEIEKLDTVPDYSAIFGHQIEVTLWNSPVLSSDIFKNIYQTDPKNGEKIPYRQHNFSKNRKNGLGYVICIYKPLTELQKFRKVVVLSVLFAFLVLLTAFLVSSYFVSKRLWQPFYKTLDEISRFNLDAPVTLSFSETGIIEFRQLNRIISSFSNKLKRDFIRMKSFSENLSHEINTMLAIINTKVELILQEEDLKSNQVEHFKTIHDVTNNLMHLNYNLLILAKIDNQYFVNREKVEISVIIKQFVATYEDFIKEKNLTIYLNILEYQVEMNRTLASLLISNIINNSIKHNMNGGYITIGLDENSFHIENSSAQLPRIDQESMIGINAEKPIKSLGMGMEIIRRICRIYRFSLTVDDNNGKYRLELGFKHV